ncbi:tetraspanin-9-like [Ostrea edulis]|uniref:tetraspanin-9-like n=1 Tax=Ostrea edulis TaxID=37623 RepID=UPI002094D833|nr:tetraspanin-9-like [Ostrea edulis]XP_056011573.1 tetraspanin-9-like [Ostrea edulis]
MNLLGTAAAIFLIILNIVVILLGLGLLIIGALIYQKSGLVNDDISPVLNAITGGDFTLSDLIKIIAVVIIVIGVFTFLVSGSGIVGACGKNRPVLVVYAVTVFLCDAVEIFVLVEVAKLKNKLNDTIKSALLTLLSNYKGYEVDVYSIAWNLIFYLFECCGVNKQSVVDDFQSTAWSRGSDVIPGYCCKEATLTTASKLNGTTCTTNPTPQNAYINSGCYDFLNDILSGYSDAVISVSTFILFTEAMAIIASLILFWQITVDVDRRRGAERSGRVMDIELAQKQQATLTRQSEQTTQATIA